MNNTEENIERIILNSSDNIKSTPINNSSDKKMLSSSFNSENECDVFVDHTPIYTSIRSPPIDMISITISPPKSPSSFLSFPSPESRSLSPTIKYTKRSIFNNHITTKLLALYFGYRVRHRLNSEKGRGLSSQIRDTNDLLKEIPDDETNKEFIDSLYSQKINQINVLIYYIRNY